MVATLFCLVFPAMLLYAAWSDVCTMLIDNWVSIVLALAFFPAAWAAGLSMPEIGAQLGFGAIALLAGAALFYLGIFGGGDAKVIAAASLWIGFPGAPKFLFVMALAGGLLAATLIILRRMKIANAPAWAAKMLSPTEGAPYAVAIAIGAIMAAPASPVIAAGIAASGLA